MSAVELRKAASLMRERAEVATPSPWRRTGVMVRSGRSTDAPVYAGQGIATCGAAKPYTGCTWHAETPDGQQEPNADHIASWSPAVALAVADWLEREAALHDTIAATADLLSAASVELGHGEIRLEFTDTGDSMAASTMPQALTVARAYLGSDE